MQRESWMDAVRTRNFGTGRIYQCDATGAPAGLYSRGGHPEQLNFHPLCVRWYGLSKSQVHLGLAGRKAGYDGAS